MKWTVLGYQSPYPGENGATPGYLLEEDSYRVLIDCGSGVLAQLANYIEPYQLDAVILSHLHHDHIADFFVLQYAIMLAMKNGWRKKALPVWAPSSPAKWYKQLSYKTWIDLNPIQSDSSQKIGPFDFHFYQTDHGIPCYAMQISNGKTKILYGADAGPQTDWKRMSIEPDLFICEATFLEANRPEHLSGHLTAGLAAEAAAQIEAKHLLLTHLFPSMDPMQVKKEAIQRFEGICDVAELGWSITMAK
ncbi:Ribonuclease BN, tRNA processing enzyme [Seinonella peptonophila]|uniref:Ribonuclease BN, tRNA processing enzyme n=2 Tax=Seinonella peptonophila TaxID=112248 RepID=A0A1M4YRC4_9BACL|nr:Ribonuclease BN, tRNA processing enzyme [Seinonella peptonophila]